MIGPDLRAVDSRTQEIPDWRSGITGIPLTGFGIPTPAIALVNHGTPVGVAAEFGSQALQGYLDALQHASNGNPGFFNGPLLAVTAVDMSCGEITVHTRPTHNHDYIASAYACRNFPRAKLLPEYSAIADNHHMPPQIIPFAIHTALMTPDERIILEQRKLNIYDWPGRLTSFGGAYNPVTDDPNPQIAMLHKLQHKYGISGLEMQQLLVTGLAEDVINGIVCTSNIVRLTARQHQELKANARQRKAVLAEITAPDYNSLAEFLQLHDITSWDPNAMFNIIYSLAALNYLSADQAQRIWQKQFAVQKRMREKNGDYEYDFPMIRHLRTHMGLDNRLRRNELLFFDI